MYHPKLSLLTLEHLHFHKLDHKENNNLDMGAMLKLVLALDPV